MTTARPLPLLRGEERIYFTHAAAGELVFQTCRSCTNRQWYFRSVCISCSGTDLEVTVASGQGTVYSFTTLYRAGHPSRTADLPYTVALVDLDEGVRVFTELVDIAPEDVRVGLDVTVRFDQVRPELTLPVFKMGGASNAR